MFDRFQYQQRLMRLQGSLVWTSVTHDPSSQLTAPSVFIVTTGNRQTLALHSLCMSDKHAVFPPLKLRPGRIFTTTIWRYTNSIHFVINNYYYFVLGSKDPRAKTV